MVASGRVGGHWLRSFPFGAEVVRAQFLGCIITLRNTRCEIKYSEDRNLAFAAQRCVLAGRTLCTVWVDELRRGL
jgi:hypothetical protein